MIVNGVNQFEARLHQERFDPKEPWTELVLPNGHVIMVPTEHLKEMEDGTLWLSLELAELGVYEPEPSTAIVIPIIKEEMKVEKRQVPIGKVTVKKRVHNVSRVIQENLWKDTLEVEHVRIDRMLERGEELPQTRHDEDLTVIPVLEEVLVLEKRVVLREEIRLRRQRTERVHSEQVSLRREEVELYRTRQNGSSDPKMLPDR